MRGDKGITAEISIMGIVAHHKLNDVSQFVNSDFCRN